MTLEQMLKWKRGSFEEYEKLIKSQDKLNKKLRKVNDDIEWETDIVALFNQSKEDEYPKWKIHNDKLRELFEIKDKLLSQIKENNERFENEFY